MPTTVKDQIVMAGNSATSMDDYAESVANILIQKGINEPAPGIMKKILCATMENMPGQPAQKEPLLNEIYGIVSTKIENYSQPDATDTSMACKLVAKSSLFDKAVKQRKHFENIGEQIEGWTKKVREKGLVTA